MRILVFFSHIPSIHKQQQRIERYFLVYESTLLKKINVVKKKIEKKKLRGKEK